MTTTQPWTLIVETRTSPPPSLDRIAMMLRLTRRARKNRGDVIVVADEATRRRLTDAGLAHWLRIADTIDAARTGQDTRPQTAAEPLKPARCTA